MVTGLRASLSLFMLIGFYVLTLGLMAGTVALAIAAASVAPALIKLTFPLFIAVFGGAGYALWKSAVAKPEAATGVPLTPHQAPRLWSEVDNLARAAGTRPPDEIRIVPDVNAGVSEQTKLLGLLGGRRLLYIGIPLFHALTMAELRAVLAHELGHYSGAHTRLGAIAYRGRLAVAGTVSRIGKWNPAGWLFRGYGLLYLLADAAVSRRQELEADAAAVRAAGRAVAVGALTELHVVDAAYAFYLKRYVSAGAEHKLLPDDVFGGFGRMLRARRDELDGLRSGLSAEPPSRSESRWETHPPLAVRVAAINALPDAGVANDPRRAADLLPDLDHIGTALQRMTVKADGRRVLPWDLFAGEVATAQLQAKADAIFRELGRAFGQRTIDLPMVLRQIEAGNAGAIAAPFFPKQTRREAVQRLGDVLEPLITLAAVRSGRAAWRHSWTNFAELVDVSGCLLDLAPLAALAAQPETLPSAAGALAKYGVDLSAAIVVEQVASARGARLVAGLANVKVDGADNDIYVLDNGLVFVPVRGDKDHGAKRMRAVAATVPAAQLAERDKFLPYEEMASIAFRRRIPLDATIAMRGGQEIHLKESWTGEHLTKADTDELLKVFDMINQA